MRYFFRLEKLRYDFLDYNNFGIFIFQTRVFEEGKDVLCCEFRTLLNRHGRPCPAIMILDLIGDDGNFISRDISSLLFVLSLNLELQLQSIYCRYDDYKGI